MILPAIMKHVLGLTLPFFKDRLLDFCSLNFMPVQIMTCCSLSHYPSLLCRLAGQDCYDVLDGLEWWLVKASPRSVPLHLGSAALRIICMTNTNRIGETLHPIATSNSRGIHFGAYCRVEKLILKPEKYT